MSRGGAGLCLSSPPKAGGFTAAAASAYRAMRAGRVPRMPRWLRQPRHGSRAWYCPFTLASGSDPKHESRVALLVAPVPEEIDGARAAARRGCLHGDVPAEAVLDAHDLGSVLAELLAEGDENVLRHVAAGAYGPGR